MNNPNTPNNPNNPSNLGDKLAYTVHNAADGIKDVTQSTVESVKQTIHDQKLSEDASKYMQKGMDSIHDMSHQIKSSATKYADGCSNYISEKPMKSVAIAVGLGALLALVLMKKKH